LKELEKDKARDVQSSRPQQQNLEAQIVAMDSKINKLIDIYLEGSLSLEEYQQKKKAFINEKKDLQERMKDFAAGGDNWFERAKDFVTDLNRISCVLRDGDLASQREYLEKIGSNFILKERRLNFSSEGTFRHYLFSAPYKNWRTRSIPIRTVSEITSRIMIPVNKQASLYKIFAHKAKQLHMLGMSYEAIGRSLKISQETARRACLYEY
jgi:hypothetical protein